MYNSLLQYVVWLQV